MYIKTVIVNYKRASYWLPDMFPISCLQFKIHTTETTACQKPTWIQTLQKQTVERHICAFALPQMLYAKSKTSYPIQQLCAWRQRRRKETWLHTYFLITSLCGDIRTRPQMLNTRHWTAGFWREEKLSGWDVLDMSSLGWNLTLQHPGSVAVFCLNFNIIIERARITQTVWL